MLKIRHHDPKSAAIALALYLATATMLSGAVEEAPVLPPDAVLADEPLFSTSSRVKPNMVLDLSVEFPTTGAAYRTGFDITKSYVGYWDPMGCYDYALADGYFKRSASATVSGGEIVCAGKWSGNMLNWAASSAIDMLRYAMTGGDRVEDTADTTVLQRAVLQDNFYNAGANFPARVLSGNLDKLTPLSEALGAAGTVRIANCRDRLFVGSTASGSCSDPGTDQSYGPGGDAPYFARVQVCAADEGPIRRDLCVKQPAGNYKPVGTIQTYSARMRFAAFGYLMDNTNARYGGVLRAPMKFAGPTTENARFEKIANEAAEWDADTGVFFANPLASTERSSGVVNYLNKFGRTGPVPGTYKSLDAVGEMYYESLRYLQGQLPTDQATMGMTEAMKDGFPVYNQTAKWGFGARSTWDPVVASCQKNYILAVGDLNTHHDHSLPGLNNDGLDGWPSGLRAADLANLEPDTAAWAALVGAFENDEAKTYTHPSGKKDLKTYGNAGGPRAFAYRNGAQITSTNISALDTGADRGSLAWSGLAYWANTQKIRSDYPDVRVKTYTIDVDEVGDGTIRQGKRGSAYYLAAKYGGFDDKNDDGNPFVTTVGAGSAASLSNSEWQSGVDDDGQPRPSNYFLASKPEEMIAAIRQIFAKAGAASGTIAGGALSGTRIASSGSHVYVSQLDSTRWSGSLLAYPLAYDAELGVVAKGDTPTWSAGALLTASAVKAVPRKIFTQLSSKAGAEFLWTAVAGDKALADLLNAEPLARPGARDELGEGRVAYLRGDRSGEVGSKGIAFRVRDSLMGDVVNSAPLLVGAPSSAVQGKGYDTFVTAYKDRTRAVYVGANDGMLHAFAADTGAELFAYVPRSVYARLGAYTSPDYVHQPYVDGSAAAGEVQSADGSWRTALVSGLGGGARGVFALDVTDPAQFSASSVLWEFTRDDDPDMGYVTQAPRIMKFRTALATDGKPAVYRWFAVVPSGFNNTNENKAAALFLLSLDKAPTDAWERDRNYYKIVLPNPADTTVANALGPVGDQAASDNSARLLYAGDTQGNLWKFDFSKSAPWSEANALPLRGAPLMVAKDANGNRQPITIAPEVGAGPNGGAIVLFGTGKLVEVDDLGSRRVQTLYGVYDTQSAIPANEARTQLQARTVAANAKGQFTISGNAFVYGPYDGNTSRRRGWYFDLPQAIDSGERQVSRMLLSDGFLLFNTLIPNPNACGAGGGGHSCGVNAMSGLSEGSTCIPSTIGLLASPLIIQEGEGAYTSTDSFGRRIETRKVAVINLGTGTGNGPGVAITRPIEGGKVSQVAGRLNWRQVLNYKDRPQ